MRASTRNDVHRVSIKPDVYACLMLVKGAERQAYRFRNWVTSDICNNNITGHYDDS